MESENIIELGDIVKFIAPENDKLHDASYFVSFVDPLSMLELIHVGTMQTLRLPIVKGKLLEENIQHIHVISRSAHKGYARQNGLFPGTWLTIEFGGEIPAIVTAQITALTEDMITLLTFPDNETLYLDFEYKGIPKALLIDRICIRDKPASYDAEVLGDQTIEEVLEEARAEIDMTYDEHGDIYVNMPENLTLDPTYQEHLQQMFNSAQVEVDEEPFQYQVDLPSRFIRYKLETQVNHLLDDFLATVSDANRKDRVMRKIYTHVQRFQELREMYSEKDAYDQVIGPLLMNPLTHKPLVDALSHMNHTVPWIKPVVTHHKLIYNVADKAPADGNVLMDENEVLKRIMRVNYENNQAVKYQEYHETYTGLVRPFDHSSVAEDILVSNLAVEDDVDVILSNDNRFRSHAVRVKEKAVVSTQFAVSRYNRASDYPAYNPRTRQTTLETLLPSDRMTVRSLLMLPLSTVPFTKLYLPSTSVLHKANLHRNLLYLFPLLTHRTFRNLVQRDIEIGDKIDQEKTIVPMQTAVQHIVLDRFQEQLEDKTEEEVYQLFLQQTIPSVFSAIQTVKSDDHLYSVSEFVDKLESFLIYHKDVSFKAMKTIQYHVRDNIQSYINQYQSDLQEFNALLLHRYNNPKMSLPAVYHNFNQKYGTTNILIELKSLGPYGLSSSTETSALLREMYLVDGGLLFHVCLRLANIDLVSPTELIENDLEEDTEIESITVASCTGKRLSKRYRSIKELQDDNDNRELEYDKEFDLTNYDILKKYKNEKESMDNDVFVDFLAEQLVLKHKCPRSISEKMAQTLIRGKQYVDEGNYAVLEIRPQYLDGDESALSEKERRQHDMEADVRRTVNYYRRVKHHWVYDKDIDENTFVDTNALLCNISKSCYQDQAKDKCESNDDAKIRMRKQSKEEIMKEVTERYQQEVTKRTESLKELADKLGEDAQRRILSEFFVKKIFDLNAFALGKSAVFLESVVSPYKYLHDLIMQPSFDFHKKQEYIIQIVRDYCREPLEDESPHWKYCKKTDTPLMENSLYLLALAYHNDEYNKVLAYLCRTVGREDDDYVYDKETGCILKNIEYQEDANQDFGRTRDVDKDDFELAFEGLTLEESANEMQVDATLGQKKKAIAFDAETQYYYNLMVALCKKGEGVDIDIESIQDVVLQLCTALSKVKQIFMSEKIYNAQQEERKKKNTKASAPTYKKYIATKKLEVLVCCVIIAVQSLVPSVKRRKTYPGCVQSFRGYPVQDGMDDMSTITYFACVLRKVSKETDAMPWNTVPKKENAMEDRLRMMLDKFVVPHPIANNIIITKRVYDMEHANDVVIPEQLDVAKNWLRFTPIIVPFSVTTGKSPLRNVSHGFQEELLATIRQGKLAQCTHIGVLQNKIDLFAAAANQAIREIVRQQEPLLVTQSKVPFLQNACCHKSAFMTPLAYFADTDNSIESYVASCRQNALALQDVGLLSKAFFLNEKRLGDSITPFDHSKIENAYKTYGDKHGYVALIHYCHFDEDTKPIPMDLRDICPEKLENYDVKASLEEKIEFMKDNGQRLSSTKFIEMMKVIHRRNCIHVHTHEVRARDEVKLHIQDMESSLKEFQEVPESLSKFVDLFWKIFDHETEEYETMARENEEAFVSCVEEEKGEPAEEPAPKTSKEAKYEQFVDFVTPEIDAMKLKLQKFLQEQNKTAFSKAKLATIFSMIFDDQAETDYIQYCQYMKNYLYGLCVEFPLRIVNDAYNDPVLCSHWPMTDHDQMEVHSYVREVGRLIEPFHQDATLMTLLRHARKLLHPVSSILQYFYHFFPEQNTKLYVRLFQYLCLIVFHLYIELASDPVVTGETFHAVRREEDTSDDIMEVTDIVPTDDIVANIHKRLGDLFEVFLHKGLTRKYEFPTMTYAEIMKRVERSAEEEKHSMKEYFHKMSKEERKAELMMKSLHLGVFNVNNKKLISYGNNQDDLFGAVVSEEELNVLEDELVERMMNPGGEGDPTEEVEMPEENDADAEPFHEDPDEDMYDIAENAFERSDA